MMTTSFFGNDVGDALYDCERGSEPNAHAFYLLWTERMSVVWLMALRYVVSPSPPAPLPLARERGAEISFEALYSDQRLYSTITQSAARVMPPPLAPLPLGEG